MPSLALPLVLLQPCPPFLKVRQTQYGKPGLARVIKPTTNGIKKPAGLLPRVSSTTRTTVLFAVGATDDDAAVLGAACRSIVTRNRFGFPERFGLETITQIHAL